MESQVAQIEYESAAALFIQLLHNEEVLARATAFVAEGRGWSWLVTCRHNVTGRHADTGQPLSPTGAWPNRIRLWASEAKLGAWVPVDVDLYGSDQMPLWHEHPVLGGRADVVALPVHGLPPGLTHHPLSLAEPSIWLQRRVTSEVYIVGYPDGFDATANAPLGVWTRGSIATEPLLQVGGLPVTLVDARTRSGQSGSPVFLQGGAVTAFEDGNLSIGVPAEARRQLIGIYSGRTNASSDLGKVWRLEVIRDIVKQGVRAATPWGEPAS